MASIKYQSRTEEETSDGLSIAITYQGTQEELRAWQKEHPIGSYDVDCGRLVRTRLHQGDGPIWLLDVDYRRSTGELAFQSGTKAPPTDYGVKSCRLHGGMLACDLSVHPDYRTHWNHYLIAVEGSSVPGWWSSATSAASPDRTYRWVQNLSELPVGLDSEGHAWKCLKDPTMLGVTTYEVGTYQIVEVARFSDEVSAGKMVANRLNKIAKPITVFGITGGEWKCDNAEISWSGKYWLATLTYTRSGNNAGWRGLYKSAKS